MAYVLGIDLGTSSVKIVLVNGKQQQIGIALVGLKTSRPEPGWSEQQPEDWWKAVKVGLAKIRDQFPREFDAVLSIGLSGQMHGVVLLDASGLPVCPAILWNDARAVAEASHLKENFPDISELAGVLPMAGLTGPKVLWLKNNRGELLKKAVSLVSVKDYINFRLTGRLCTDYSDAAGTWLFDQKKRVWQERALNLVGLDLSQMVELVESHEIIGKVCCQAAEETGLGRQIDIVCGGGDTPVGAFGSSIVKSGTTVISLGTSANIFTPTDDYIPAVENLIHSFCHVIPETWYQMAALLNGASVFAWFSSIVGKPVDECDRMVEENYKRPSNILFLPYLAGERTPHNNPDARGLFFGLSPSADTVQLAQAVFEGVAYSLLESKECFAKQEFKTHEIILAGGGSKSRIWSQIIASVLNQPVTRQRGSERGAAFGAARLALVGAGIESQAGDRLKPDVEEIVHPQQELVEEYAENYIRFKKLYRAVVSEF